MALWLVSHTGLAAASLTPRLGLVAEERYDDDELLRQSGSTAGQLRTRLTSRLGLDLKAPTLVAKSWYAADLLLHHGSGSVKVDHRGELEARKRLSRQTSIGSRVELWRVSDPTSLPRFGVARSLSPILYARALAEGELTPARRWALLGQYRFEGARVYDEVGRSGWMHGPSVEASYALFARARVGAAYRYQYFADAASTAQAHSALATFLYRVSRQTRVAVRGGPTYFSGADVAERGALPQVALELGRDGRFVDLTLTAGQELVGASGFGSALWAQYAQGVAGWRPAARLNLFGAVSYFRNGRAPHLGLNPFGPPVPSTYEGYTLAAGVEWQLHSTLSLGASFDRFSQVGGGVEGGELTRNIVGARLSVTPF